MKRILAVIFSTYCILAHSTSSTVLTPRVIVLHENYMNIFKCISVRSNTQRIYTVSAVLPIEVENSKIHGMSVENKKTGFRISEIQPETSFMRVHFKLEVQESELKDVVIYLHSEKDYAFQPYTFKDETYSVVKEYLNGNECSP